MSDDLFLTFDDLTILPGRNRGTPDDVSLRGAITSRFTLQVPLLSAAMPTITESEMAIAMGEFGGLGVLHRVGTIEEQCAHVERVCRHRPDNRIYPHATLGLDGGLLAAASVTPGDVERAQALTAAGASILFLDTPNPTNDDVLAGFEAVRRVTDVSMVIGSVVDAETARRYLDAGADAIKVGLGSGALCSMRRTTGVGVPQVMALQHVCAVAGPAGVPVISDGGATCGGDIVKALAVGASAVMLGSMVAGCDETPPPIEIRDGVRRKRLSGLRLADFEIETPTGYPKVDAYLREHEAPRVEGGDTTIAATGPAHLRLMELSRSIRGGFQMIGAQDLAELRERAKLVRVSPAGSAEAHVGGFR